MSDWIETYTGRLFYPLEPRAQDVDILDIAHALAMQCRFAGHCREFYSIAQHSVRVSLLCPPEYALWGLLHDASEAYLVDIPRPLKRSAAMKPYRDAEARVMRAVCEHFGLWPEEPEVIRAMDNAVLFREAHDFMTSQGAGWELSTPLLKDAIIPLLPNEAKLLFLGRYTGITGKGR